MAEQCQELEQQAASLTEYTPQSIHIYKRISELSEVTSSLKQFEDAQTVLSTTTLPNDVEHNGTQHYPHNK